ncbi:MAG TPA: tyrosine-protein phosphatase [Tepidisphaeraceae bacterium]|jgi:undecaprenyl-diphosphatase
MGRRKSIDMTDVLPASRAGASPPRYPGPRTARLYRRVLYFALIALFIFLTIWLPLHFFYFNFHPIIANEAYRSAQPSPAFLKKIVAQNHIRSIIKFNREVESSWSQEEFSEAKKLGVDIFYIPIGVSELPSRNDMIHILSAIDHAPRPLLVHCKTGADRTGLASVLLAMQAGESFQEARNQQLRLRYGHIGQIGADVDDVLTQYDQDRTAEGKSDRSYADFRNYVLEEYYPGFYHAGIVAEPNTLSGHPGDKVTFQVKVTNASPRAWNAWVFPFRLNLGIPGTRSGNYPELITHKLIGWSLQPGQTETVDLSIKIPKTTLGIHRYVLDVAQVMGTTFAHYGSPTANVYLDVK